MTQRRLALLLYSFMVAHKATCQTLSKAFLKSMKIWWRSCWCWIYFSKKMVFFKIKIENTHLHPGQFSLLIVKSRFAFEQ